MQSAKRVVRGGQTVRQLSVIIAALLGVVSALLAGARAVADETTLLAEAHNFHRISDTLLTAGQIYPAQVPDLSETGVGLVINLAVADAERNAEEAFAIAQAGIGYVNIPVIWDNPTAADLQLFFDLMDARGDRTTLVHCFANYRASAFTYLYRVLREGVPEAEARRDLLAIWDDEAFAQMPQWRRFIDEALAAGP